MMHLHTGWSQTGPHSLRADFGNSFKQLDVVGQATLNRCWDQNYREFLWCQMSSIRSDAIELPSKRSLWLRGSQARFLDIMNEAHLTTEVEHSARTTSPDGQPV